MEHISQNEISYYIVTSDNRMLTVNQSLQQQFELKAVSRRRVQKPAWKIILHEDNTVSLSFHKKEKILWCYCDPQSKILQFTPKIVTKDVKPFRFFPKGDSNERIYFESCAKKGWFIHTAESVVTMDNDNNKMEAKYFKIMKL